MEDNDIKDEVITDKGAKAPETDDTTKVEGPESKETKDNKPDEGNKPDKDKDPEETKDNKPDEDNKPDKDKDPEETKDNKPDEDKKPEDDLGTSENESAYIKEVEAKDAEIKSLTAELESAKGKADNYEAIVKAMVEERLAKVPEELSELVPDTDLAGKLEWLNKAESKGLFGKANPQIEIGRQMKQKRENTRDLQDGLTATQRLSNSFTAYFTGKK